MKIFMVALLLAIGYAQTAMTGDCDSFCPTLGMKVTKSMKGKQCNTIKPNGCSQGQCCKASAQKKVPAQNQPVQNQPAQNPALNVGRPTFQQALQDLKKAQADPARKPGWGALGRIAPVRQGKISAAGRLSGVQTVGASPAAGKTLKDPLPSGFTVSIKQSGVWKDVKPTGKLFAFISPGSAWHDRQVQGTLDPFGRQSCSDDCNPPNSNGDYSTTSSWAFTDIDVKDGSHIGNQKPYKFGQDKFQSMEDDVRANNNILSLANIFQDKIRNGVVPAAVLCFSKGCMGPINQIWHYVWRGPTLVYNGGSLMEQGFTMPDKVFPVYITSRYDTFSTKSVTRTVQMIDRQHTINKGWTMQRLQDEHQFYYQWYRYFPQSLMMGIHKDTSSQSSARSVAANPMSRMTRTVRIRHCAPSMAMCRSILQGGLKLISLGVKNRFGPGFYVTLEKNLDTAFMELEIHGKRAECCITGELLIAPEEFLDLTTDDNCHLVDEGLGRDGWSDGTFSEKFPTNCGKSTDSNLLNSFSRAGYTVVKHWSNSHPGMCGDTYAKKANIVILPNMRLLIDRGSLSFREPVYISDPSKNKLSASQKEAAKNAIGDERQAKFMMNNNYLEEWDRTTNDGVLYRPARDEYLKDDTGAEPINPDNFPGCTPTIEVEEKRLNEMFRWDKDIFTLPATLRNLPKVQPRTGCSSFYTEFNKLNLGRVESDVSGQIEEEGIKETNKESSAPETVERDNAFTSSPIEKEKIAVEVKIAQSDETEIMIPNLKTKALLVFVLTFLFAWSFSFCTPQKSNHDLYEPLGEEDI